MDRLVQTHLNRADNLGVRVNGLQQLVACLCTAHIGEYEGVDILALETCERIFVVTQLLVQGEVHLHLTVDDKVRILVLQLLHSLMHTDWASHLVGSEVRVAYHCHARFLVEELHGMGCQLGDVHEYALVRMAVDECVGKVEYALAGVQDMHSGEGVILLADANHFFSHLDGVRVFRVKTSDECVSITRLHHHHAEVVTLVHLVVCLLEGIALTCTLLGKVLGVSGAASLLLVGTHVYQLYAVKIELQTLSHTTQTVGVSKQDREADTLCLCLYCSLHH